jgi:predicted GIY-YIG superfamily endonuclease
VDALVLRGDEGRGTLRKAAGRGERPLIRGYPNGETRPATKSHETSMHYLYVLRSKSNHADFYVGATSDLRQRVTSHNEGRNASTRGRQWELVYYEAYRSREAAFERERILKHDGRVRRFLMERLKKHLV